MISLKLIGGILIFSALLTLLLRVVGLQWQIKKPILALSAFLILSGIVMAVAQQNEYRYYQDVEGWPKVMATVKESRIIGERAILPEIVYEYQVKGQSFEGRSDLNIPGFGNRKRRQQTARIIIADYPEGKQISVRYDPADPADSLLRTSPPWNLYGKLGFGTFLAGSGFFLLFLNLFPSRNRG